MAEKKNKDGLKPGSLVHHKEVERILREKLKAKAKAKTEDK